MIEEAKVPFSFIGRGQVFRKLSNFMPLLLQRNGAKLGVRA